MKDLKGKEEDEDDVAIIMCISPGVLNKTSARLPRGREMRMVENEREGRILTYSKEDDFLLLRSLSVCTAGILELR